MPEIIILEKIETRKGNFKCLIECNFCHKSKLIDYWQVKRGEGKYCSRKCFFNANIPWNKGKKNIFSEHTREKISKAQIGKKITLSTRIKQSISHRGNKAYNWKGNLVSYRALHTWVNKWKGKARKCEMCGKIRKNRDIQWANIDHQYKRNLNDYIALCYKCHGKYDKKYQLRINF